MAELARNHLHARLDALLDRYRGSETCPTRREVEALYTEGCANLLQLEAERLRVQRRAGAMEADGRRDPCAAARAAELRRSCEQIAEDIASLRRLVQLLRTAVDWGEAGPPSGAAARDPLHGAPG
jgi:hypothetical protein